MLTSATALPRQRAQRHPRSECPCILQDVSRHERATMLLKPCLRAALTRPADQDALFSFRALLDTSSGVVNQMLPHERNDLGGGQRGQLSSTSSVPFTVLLLLKFCLPYVVEYFIPLKCQMPCISKASRVGLSERSRLRIIYYAKPPRQNVIWVLMNGKVTFGAHSFNLRGSREKS